MVLFYELPNDILEKIFFEVHKLNIKLSFDIIKRYVPKQEYICKFNDYVLMNQRPYLPSIRLVFDNVSCFKREHSIPSKIETMCIQYLGFKGLLMI
jgi:hypothetical protein